MDELFSITELAKLLGITPRTIRFYEDRGLVTPRRVGTTRVYGIRDRARMILVLRGKRLGFSVRAHRLQITATCEEFKKLGACSKRGA